MLFYTIRRHIYEARNYTEIRKGDNLNMIREELNDKLLNDTQLLNNDENDMR